MISYIIEMLCSAIWKTKGTQNNQDISPTENRLVDGIWYYLDGSGAMYRGWLWYGNAWYYLLEDGTMAVGSHQIDGTAYEFASDGRMI